MRQTGKLLLLATLLCLLLACEADRTTPCDQNPPQYIAEIMPGDWQHVGTCRLDTDGDSKEEWVVLYQFDQLPETKPHGNPIAAVVYQADDQKPPNILAHPLHPPDRDYLCECVCTPEMEDVLSGLSDRELVVRDQCNGETAVLTIFHWDPGLAMYLPRGHFHGHQIGVALNEVRVEERLLDRAQLAVCKTYYPRDNMTYYQSDNQTALVQYDKYELTFCHGEPKDVMSSFYPEKVVLSFYNHYTATEKVQAYFTAAGWGQLELCDTGLCGCLSTRSDIAQVWVTGLQPEPENFIENKGHTPNEAIVGVTITCKYLSGMPNSERFIRWSLVREDNMWKLDHVEEIR